MQRLKGLEGPLVYPTCHTHTHTHTHTHIEHTHTHRDAFRRWKCGHDSDFFTYTRKADQQDYTEGEVQYPEYTSLEV